MKRSPKKAETRFKAYIELTKPSIAVMILVSTALGYYLGGNGILDYGKFFITLLGSCLISSGAGALNHYIEENSDSLMDRTKNRPIPSGMISSKAAKKFGIFLTLSGSLILFVFINSLTCLLALSTTVLYIFIYTPLKRVTWLNTSIGAIPGAIPPLGGWAAATGELVPEAWILFAILFLWQHPHFYAIALMCRDDYKKANLQMLPVLEKDGSRTNRQIIWHSILLIPVSIMFSFIGMMGQIYYWGALLLGIGYLIAGFPLIKNYSIENAKLLLKVSVFYLPSLFGIIILDRIL